MDCNAAALRGGYFQRDIIVPSLFLPKGFPLEWSKKKK
jgi:hypothetical protein